MSKFVTLDSSIPVFLSCQQIGTIKLIDFCDILFVAADYTLVPVGTDHGNYEYTYYKPTCYFRRPQTAIYFLSR